MIRVLLASALVLGAVAAAPAAPAAGLERYLAPASVCPGQANAGAAAATKIRAIRCLLNHARTERGLDRLRRHRKLDRAARLKLADNVRCDEFSHTACGKPFLSIFRRAGYVTAATQAYALGENLAWGQGRVGTPRAIVLAWLRSDGHRRNLFADAWREMGVAYRLDAMFVGHRQVALWANTFGRRT